MTPTEARTARDSIQADMLAAAIRRGDRLAALLDKLLPPEDAAEDAPVSPVAPAADPMPAATLPAVFEAPTIVPSASDDIAAAVAAAVMVAQVNPRARPTGKRTGPVTAAVTESKPPPAPDDWVLDETAISGASI